MTKLRDSITDESVADIRWRLETALEKLDDSLWYSAMELMVEAAEVTQAMIEAIQADQRAEAKAAHASTTERKP